MKAVYKIYFKTIVSFFGLSALSLFNIVNAASISVKVIDAKNNKVLAGATIILKSDNLTAIGSTDKKGFYQFNNLGAGTYYLSSTFIGFEALENKPIMLDNINANINVELVMTEATRYLSELVVSGKADRETDASSRFTERTSPNIVNVISASAIQISPDITLANVAQRISGVTLVRNGLGDGQYAIIRGIDPRYNNTLINGIKIPSPDPTNRFIPLDIIPAQLVQRMEVTKALTPDMEGDAIGGTINAVMKDAPEQPLLSVNVATGYSQILLDRTFLAFNNSSINFKDPNQAHGGTYNATQDDFNKNNLRFSHKQAPINRLYGITAGKRFVDNKLGVLLSATNQSTYKSANSVQFVTVTTPRNLPNATDIISRDIYTEQVRTGINAKADYELNEKNKFEVYGLFLRMSDIQSRYITDTIYNDPGRYGPGTGKVAVQTRSRLQQQTVENITLQGTHTILTPLTLNWSTVYSRAIYQVPDMAEISTYHTIKPDSSFDGASDYLNDITHSWQKSKDQDIAAYLNLEYKGKLKSFPLSIKGGGLLRSKERYNYQNNYQLKPVLVKDSTYVKVTRNGSESDSLVYFYKNPPYKGIDSAGVFPYQSVGNPQFNTSNYTATEKILAGYLQGTIVFGNLKVLMGTRVEITSQSNRNKVPSFPGYRQNYFDYYDWLPSLHLTYEVKENQNLRFSVFKSISRPNYFELVKYTIIGDQSNISGNPQLKHVRATSYDIRYEWYSSKEDVLQVGLFYKKLIDPIEILLDQNGGQPLYKPINSGLATSYGFELVFIKYFKRIGFSANYTFTNSNVASPKVVYTSTNGTSADGLFYINEKRPLQGQSKHIGNASLLYKDKKLKCQLALIYQGKRIAQVSPYYGLDYYQSDYVDLSFSAERFILSKLVVFCKLNNLLNTPYKLETKGGYHYQQDIYKQNYLIGIRFQL